MNIIKELAEKSTTHSIEYAGINAYKVEKFDKERFAELIIKECTEYLIHATEVHNQRDQDMMIIAAKKLREHFGVE